MSRGGPPGRGGGRRWPPAHSPSWPAALGRADPGCRPHRGGLDGSWPRLSAIDSAPRAMGGGGKAPPPQPHAARLYTLQRSAGAKPLLGRPRCPPRRLLPALAAALGLRSSPPSSRSRHPSERPTTKFMSDGLELAGPAVGFGERGRWSRRGGPPLPPIGRPPAPAGRPPGRPPRRCASSCAPGPAASPAARFLAGAAPGARCRGLPGRPGPAGPPPARPWAASRASSPAP